MRMRVTYHKGEDARWIGHLDLMRAMQRALRRSGLPIRYSSGFHPHVLLTFAPPLGAGMLGAREIMDVPLSADITPDAFLSQLKEALPPALQATGCYLAEDDAPAPMAETSAAEYLLRFYPTDAARTALAAADAFFAQNEIRAVRKTKSAEREEDIKPLILSLTKEPDAWTLRAALSLTERGALKASLLCASLCAFAGIDPADAPVEITRARLYRADERMRLSPLDEPVPKGWVPRVMGKKAEAEANAGAEAAGAGAGTPSAASTPAEVPHA